MQPAQHDLILPNHSRTSSSASSVGSSYVSSTDSSKATASHTVSPTHMHNDAFEANNNFLNSNFHSAATTLPRFQPAYNALISELHSTQEMNGNDKHDGVDTKANESHSIYGTLRPLAEHSKNDKLTAPRIGDDKENESQTDGATDKNVDGMPNFVYKTMDGSVVRSVHPPGKGNSTTYKVSLLLMCAASTNFSVCELLIGCVVILIYAYYGHFSSTISSVILYAGQLESWRTTTIWRWSTATSGRSTQPSYVSTTN